ncbi:MAG: FkbM family methyltransferase [Candidatus Magnetomorum sp.]|nr:FkbM family methyltransferase [Candidatus Magnetomorum sp.]
MRPIQFIKEKLFKHLSFKQINRLRKIKWIFYSLFINDARDIKRFHSNELEIVIIEHLVPIFLKDSQPTLLDIGANIGGYSYYLAPLIAKFNGQCIAFEPRLNIYQRLKKNVICNNFTAERLALSNVNGFFNLYLPTSHGCSSFIYRPEFEGLTTEEVPVSKLDDYVKNNGIKAIGFIKIDVEGHEIEVIEGAVHTIQEFHPILLCESEDRYIRHSGKSTQMFIDIMIKLNYQVYVISKKKLKILPIEEITIPKEKHGQDEYFYNYWFFPKHLDKQLLDFFNNCLKKIIIENDTIMIRSES